MPASLAAAAIELAQVMKREVELPTGPTTMTALKARCVVQADMLPSVASWTDSAGTAVVGRIAALTGDTSAVVDRSTVATAAVMAAIRRGARRGSAGASCIDSLSGITGARPEGRTWSLDTGSLV